jgi:hypothetical protein
MNKISTAISAEQELKLRVLTDHIQRLEAEQLRKLLILSVKNGMIKDNAIRLYATWARKTIAWARSLLL